MELWLWESSYRIEAKLLTLNGSNRSGYRGWLRGQHALAVDAVVAVADCSVYQVLLGGVDVFQSERHVRASRNLSIRSRLSK